MVQGRQRAQVEGGRVDGGRVDEWNERGRDLVRDGRREGGTERRINYRQRRRSQQRRGEQSDKGMVEMARTKWSDM